MCNPQIFSRILQILTALVGKIQCDFTSYLKTLSVGPAGVQTCDIPFYRLAPYQLS